MRSHTGLERRPEELLNDHLLSDTEVSGSKCSFYLGEFRERITVRLKRSGDLVFFEQSHFIKGPLRGQPYMTSRCFGEDDISPSEIHQRMPLVVGSSEMVDKVLEFLDQSQAL